MRVGIYQNHPVFGQVELNVEQTVKDLSSVDTDLMVLPELFNTGYQFVSSEETADLAEEVPSGKPCQAMMSLAKDRNIFLVFGLAEKDGKCICNSAGIVGPHGLVGIINEKTQCPRIAQA